MAPSSPRNKVVGNRQSTLIFRLINPELFVKPNKVVMVFGVVSITACLLYLSYMNTTKSGKQTQNVSVRTTPNKSKWD